MWAIASIVNPFLRCLVPPSRVFRSFGVAVFRCPDSFGVIVNSLQGAVAAIASARVCDLHRTTVNAFVTTSIHSRFRLIFAVERMHGAAEVDGGEEKNLVKYGFQFEF